MCKGAGPQGMHMEAGRKRGSSDIVCCSDKKREVVVSPSPPNHRSLDTDYIPYKYNCKMNLLLI